jgi:hypothetical protein
MTADDALARLDSAQKSWTIALESHWSAPPAPGYAERLLQLANAAEEQASAFRFADREGLPGDRCPMPPPAFNRRPNSVRTSTEPGRRNSGPALTRTSASSASSSKASAV